ncbi:DUF1007 family protein [Rhodobacter sp. 24-YEA-8]|uniref:DUF1007 family protein n=1 Tax=Rhodobacter sp. 24-YEA-8 TaxID=1884310 RepID=UPI000897657E|nr:DUF1007 family protein [Rhodobacter sp. 24-YEA-8]SEC72764.1 polyphosphate kinase [Rhodobacter sp. 24-YEA-8]
MVLRLLSLLTCFALPHVARAHPHEFVDTGLTFRFDDQGQLTAVSVAWVYDDLTSLLILSDLGMDPDGDGILTAAEAKRLNEMASTWPEGFDGNLWLSQGGQSIALSRPLDGAAGLREGRIWMTHIRALPGRRDPAGGEIRLQAYDPSYYIFYDLTGTPGIEGRPDCTARVEPADSSRARVLYEEALAALSDAELEAGGYPEIGGAFADTVLLACGQP